MSWARRRLAAAVLLVAATLAMATAGCSLVRLPPGAFASPAPAGEEAGTGPAGTGTSAGIADLTIRGRVFFPSYHVQATIGDVATAATVSLIDPRTNQAKATALTDGSGAFALPVTLVPAAGDVYFLEGVKGLGNNAVGKDAVRVRTLIQFRTGTWSGIATGQGITISTATTAVSALVGLHQGFAPVDPAAVIGTVRLGVPSDGVPDTLDAGSTGLTTAEFAQAWRLVSKALVGNHDPIDGIVYTGTGYALKPGISTEPTGPVLVAVDPPIASAGDRIVITGTGFSSSIPDNSVVFDQGVGALVLEASPTRLRVVVPAGAQSGNLVVSVGGIGATASFMVIPIVSGGFNP